MFNLFDVTSGPEQISGSKAEKPRAANAKEMRAYLRWLAERDGVTIPAQAEYRPEGIVVLGDVIVPMPGYGQSQMVTCEILDDAGNVVRTMPLPADKRGKLPMTAKQAREWSGLEPVRKSKRKKATPTPVQSDPIPVAEEEAAPMPEICPEAAREAQQPVSEVSEAVATVNVPSETEIAPAEPVTETEELPATVTESLTVDPIAEIEARLAALEAAVATLPAESDAGGLISGPSNDGEKIKVSPTVEARPRRTAAHERAIRRAWAERREARRQRESGRLFREMLETETAAVQELRAEIIGHNGIEVALSKELTEAREIIAKGRAEMAVLAPMLRHNVDRRRKSAQRARRMVAAALSAARDRQAAHNVTLSQLANLRRDLADPSQPERASDIARLLKERDEARTASAALQARAERSERAAQDMAGKFEDMVSRVTRAEAALRAVQKAA